MRAALTLNLTGLAARRVARKGLRRALGLALLAGAAATAQAHGGAPHAHAPAGSASAAPAALPDTPACASAVPGADAPAWPAVQAAFDVSVSHADGKPPAAQRWQLWRGADLIVLRKGQIEDRWQREANGAVSLARVFHDERRVVDYTAGELVTLGIAVDWLALGRFVGGAEFAALGCANGQQAADDSAEGRRYEGRLPDGRQVSLRWNEARQLPSSLERRSEDGRRVRYELVANERLSADEAEAPAGVPLDYLRIDAADFGDMPYDPFVRKVEAFDVRAGWRAPHGHE